MRTPWSASQKIAACIVAQFLWFRLRLFFYHAPLTFTKNSDCPERFQWKCWSESLNMIQRNPDLVLEPEIPLRWDCPNSNISLYDLRTDWRSVLHPSLCYRNGGQKHRSLLIHHLMLQNPLSFLLLNTAGGKLHGSHAGATSAGD